jgi:hypothetical protein
LRSLGARAASSATVSSTYRQAVAVPTLNPAARLVNVSPNKQVDQDQVGLLPGVQLPPQRAGPDPVAADDPGREVQGLTRGRQRRTVEKHGSPW